MIERCRDEQERQCPLTIKTANLVCWMVCRKAPVRSLPTHTPFVGERSYIGAPTMLDTWSRDFSS